MPKTEFATFEKALDAVLAHLNFPNEFPDGRPMPERISEGNRAARADLANAWAAMERARHALRANTAQAKQLREFEGQYEEEEPATSRHYAEVAAEREKTCELLREILGEEGEGT